VESSAEEEEFARGKPTEDWFVGSASKKTAVSRPNRRVESSVE
jgi:hypothetical protein